MDVSQQTIILYYQYIGKLLYAIASADKKIKKQEFETLKKEISLWSSDRNYINQTSDIDLEYHVISTFKKLYKEKANTQNCFDDFIVFKKTNESFFTEPTKNELLRIAGKIAGSFSNLNKSELILLAKLSIEFKKASS